MIKILLLLAFPLSCPAVQNCNTKAIFAAQNFQNYIIKEMIVDNSNISTVKRNNLGNWVYEVFSINKKGSRLRGSVVELSFYCDILSIKNFE